MNAKTPQAETASPPAAEHTIARAADLTIQDLDQQRIDRVVANFFLHIHPGRVHRHVLRPSATLGLGVISVGLFIVLAATGLMLMVYYKPSVAHAYDSVNDAKLGLAKYFKFYNQRRPHSALDDKTPDEFYFDNLPALQNAA